MDPDVLWGIAALAETKLPLEILDIQGGMEGPGRACTVEPRVMVRRCLCSCLPQYLAHSAR